jgi:outer membrane protein TolC
MMHLKLFSKKKKTFLLILSFLLPGSVGIAANDFNPKNSSRALGLRDILEEGLRKNPEEHVRNFQKSLIDIEWKDAYQEFWFPDINLKLQTDNQRVARMRKGSKAERATKTPVGSLGIELGDYTIFNWGKDYLEYLNKKESYKRNKQVIREKRRDLKHDLIVKYFELDKVKEIAKIKKSQLRQASFLYRLGKEKVSLKKISREEYYLLRGLYLRARQEYQELKISLANIEDKFSYTIGDIGGTRYSTTDHLEYRKVTLTLTEALRLARGRNTQVLNATTILANARRSYIKLKKENLPLPKISLNLGTYTQYFDKNRIGADYETIPGSSNLDVVAQINVTWNLFGAGGLFNSRKLEHAHISEKLAERRLNNSIQSSESLIRQYMREILMLESQIEIVNEVVNNSQKTFDITLENYLNKKSNYTKLESSLFNLHNNEIKYEDLKFDHLKKKIALAKSIGIEDFPGENFENIGGGLSASKENKE